MPEPENYNEDKPWSEMDILDLQNCVERGISLKEIADFLMRREDEVVEKINELGLVQRRGLGRENSC